MAQCSDPGCVEFRFDQDAALREGWGLLDGEPYCPLHYTGASWRARQAEKREQLARRANAIWAKEHLSKTDYRAWDEFQADLANFHKKHGKLAHRELRILSPEQFMRRYKDLGRIDVKLATESMEAAERAFEQRRIERFNDW